MQSTNLWHQLGVYRRQIVILVAVLWVVPMAASAQTRGNFGQTNLPEYDSRIVRFGFTLGVHNAYFRQTYSDQYLDYDTLHSIIPGNAFGFSIGFLANFHVAQYLDIRPMFKVGFYEYPLDYNYTDQSVDQQVAEAAMVELPILFKYRSVRRQNFGMYLIGGITPAIQVGGRKEDDRDQRNLLVKTEDLKVEYGFGFDIYYPLFKFSPELRVAHGLNNMLRPGINDYSAGLERLTTHSISLYLNFQ